MAHLNIYSGTITKDAVVREVTIKGNDGDRTSKVLSFTLLSKGTLRMNQYKSFDVSVWYREDEDIPLLPLLTNGKCISLVGEEFAKGNLGKDGKLYINYRVTAMRNTISFLQRKEEEDGNQEDGINEEPSQNEYEDYMNE